MNFTDELGEAGRNLSEDLQMTAKFRTPAVPRNYCVRYCYASRRDPEIRKTLAVQRVDELVRQVSQNTANYGNTIAEKAQSLESGSDAGAVVRILASETRKMLDRNQDLQSRLESSSQQIAKLKQDPESGQKEALADGLTGIANRKRFDVTLRREIMISAESGEPLCLILCDIDLFKRFNDKHGHQTGEQGLKFVGATLSDTVTAKGLPARYSGEEFGIVLPGTDFETPIGVAGDDPPVGAPKAPAQETFGRGSGKYHAVARRGAIQGWRTVERSYKTGR